MDKLTLLEQLSGKIQILCHDWQINTTSQEMFDIIRTLKNAERTQPKTEAVGGIIVLSKDEFNKMQEVLDNPPPPNDALIEAIKTHNELVGEAVDIEALKRECAEKLSALIPNSYSDATMLNIIDYLHAKGYLRNVPEGMVSYRQVAL